MITSARRFPSNWRLQSSRVLSCGLTFLTGLRRWFRDARPKLASQPGGTLAVPALIPEADPQIIKKKEKIGTCFTRGQVLY